MKSDKRQYARREDSVEAYNTIYGLLKKEEKKGNAIVLYRTDPFQPGEHHIFGYYYRSSVLVSLWRHSVFKEVLTIEVASELELDFARVFNNLEEIVNQVSAKNL